ncbi:MAG TPA: acetyltransferase [Candidatus Nanoarchaeia archaeon]|nr:acetyltransferase [Candidatus Nanoarchaeia archaeon]
MRNLYIIGTGAQAKYIIEICKDYHIQGLIDILSREHIGKIINGVKVIYFIEDFENLVNNLDGEVIVAYGNNQIKKEIVIRLEAKGYKFATIISKNAYISSFVDIGEGTIINPNVTILPNVNIGKHVIIHSGSVIEHDNELGDFVNIAPMVSTAGNVKIGEESYVYTGSVIIPKVKIGKRVIIGAGSLVLKDIPDDSVVFGVPAKAREGKL